MLEVYTRPYDPLHPLVCMDEVGKQVLRDTREVLPMKPGRPELQDYEYEREGVANLFLPSEPLMGRRWVDVTEHRTRVDWAHEIKDLVDERHPQAERIVLVMDNLNTHSPASLYEVFPPQEAGGQAGGALHPQARQLAGYGRDRAVGAQPSVPGQKSARF